MNLNILTVVQILFFAMGSYYFFKNSNRKVKSDLLSADENTRQMNLLEDMRNEALTEPLSEQTRPKTLSEIVGQEKAIKALRSALCSPNPQHILIYGPPGIGKTAAARLILEEAKKMESSPFSSDAKFVEMDATTLQFDERNIADPLMGSVHDPIYQGAGAFGQAGIPHPKRGAVNEAHGGVLFLDEIGELHSIQMNKLLKILEDRIAHFQSSYYSKNNKAIPQYIHEIFQKGIPADFRLIGATTRNPADISPALRSRCTEIFFEALDDNSIQRIAKNSLQKTGLPYEEGICQKIATYATGGRDTVNIVQSLTALSLMEHSRKITFADLDWVAETSHYQHVPKRKIPEQPQIGVVNGLAVQGSGGTLLFVEACVQPCAKGGSLTVTGIVEEEEFHNNQHSTKRKSNAKSSAENVLTYLEHFGFQKDIYHVHINFPGGIPVDGPSAGIAMFLAVYSAFQKIPVPNHIAMTGELGLLGQVLPVGGVMEKLQAAKTAGATDVFIPKENWQDAFLSIPLNIHCISHVGELLQNISPQKQECIVEDDVLTASSL